MLLNILFVLGGLITAQAQTNDVLIHLKQKANLSKAESIKDRTERITYVVNQLKSTAERSQAAVIRDLKSRGLEFQPFYIENVILVKNTTPEIRSWLKQLTSVESVRPNVEAQLTTPEPEGLARVKDVASHLVTIKADQVWRELGVRGENIVIAGQDSGYYWEHNAIRNQYRGNANGVIDHNYNWMDAIGGAAAPFDDSGHGTHTMGTMVGDDGRGNQIGVAPGAKWMGCRNMNNNKGTVASYMTCFEFFLAPYPIGGDPRRDGRPEKAPHIVNNSWACPKEEGCNGGEFLDTVRAFKAAGIMVVAAAGNDGPGCKSVADAPAMYAGELVSVGAYNRYTKDIAFFSSRGPSAWNGKLAPNLVAPGEIIRSAVNGSPNSYDDKAGTSMASPQVAGVVALLWSARPQLIGQIDRTIEILHKTASPLMGGSCEGFPGNQIPNATYGYGMIDAYRAITSVRVESKEYLVKIRPSASRTQLKAYFKNFEVVRDDVITARINLNDLPRLRQLPFVLHMEPNHRVRTLAKPNDYYFEDLWGMSNPRGFDINAPAAWDISTGSKNVVVAVIDTGMYLEHQDLRANLWVNEKEASGQRNFDDDGNGFVDDVNGYQFALNDGNPHDRQGHGTHVSGIIGASGNNGAGVVGVNWNVSLMTLNMFPTYSEAKISDAIRAIDYAVAKGARVINASWGTSEQEDKNNEWVLLTEAIQRAHKAGITFVAAAGNDGTSNDKYHMVPATLDVPNIISVGNMAENGSRSGSSNYGVNKVHVFAPGSDIYSTLSTGGYGYKSGTSMAAPHVTGVVALMLSVNPRLTPEQIKAILIQSCTPNNNLMTSSQCRGHVNAAEALRLAMGRG